MIKFKFNDLPCGTVFNLNNNTYVKIFDDIEGVSLINAYNVGKHCYSIISAKCMCEIVGLNRGSSFSRIPIFEEISGYTMFKDLPNGTIFTEIEELNEYKCLYKSYVKFDICSGENIPFNELCTADANAVSTNGFIYFDFHKDYPCKVIKLPHNRNIK